MVHPDSFDCQIFFIRLFLSLIIQNNSHIQTYSEKPEERHSPEDTNSISQCSSRNNYAAKDTHHKHYLLEHDYYGASAIFHPAVQEKFKELFPDGYWLIPSSRHEFLAVPKYDDPQLLQGLTELNADVNKNVLNSDDFLAYGILELKNGTLVPAKLPEYKIWL